MELIRSALRGCAMRTRVDAPWSVLLLLSVGCSSLVDTDRSQCRTDSDCTQRLPNSACVNALCQPRATMPLPGNPAGIWGGRRPMDASMDSTDGAPPEADAPPPISADDMVDAGSAPDALDDEDDSLDEPPVTGALAPCHGLHALGTDPELDGQLEPGLQTTPVPTATWRASPDVFPLEHQAVMASGWRPGGLYVFVDVTDNTRLPANLANPTWCGDAVEIFIDSDGAFEAVPAYDSPGTARLIVTAPVYGNQPSRRASRYRDTTWIATASSSRFFANPRAGGYTVEAFITAADLGMDSWTLTAGARIGFNIGVDVSRAYAYPDCTRRLSQYFLYISPTGSYPFEDTNAFCTPRLNL